MDLSAPLEEDVELWLLKEQDEAALTVVRHSAAHVMATAILELFPGRRSWDMGRLRMRFLLRRVPGYSVSDQDLAAIEVRMAEVVKRDERFVREEEPREVGLGEYGRKAEFMKVHFIERFTKRRGGSRFTEWRLCRFLQVGRMCPRRGG